MVDVGPQSTREWWIHIWQLGNKHSVYDRYVEVLVLMTVILMMGDPLPPILDILAILQQQLRRPIQASTTAVFMQVVQVTALSTTTAFIIAIIIIPLNRHSIRHLLFRINNKNNIVHMMIKKSHWQPYQQQLWVQMRLLLLFQFHAVHQMNIHDAPSKWHHHVHIIHGIVISFLHVVVPRSDVEFVMMIVQCYLHYWSKGRHHMWGKKQQQQQLVQPL